ncbi:hypothetical protein FF1_030664 [Malus domestica]
METLGASIVEVSRCEGNSVLSLFATLKIFHKNILTLKEELQKISRRKYDITENIDVSRLEGKHPLARL